MSATYFHRDDGDNASRARGSLALSRTFVPLPSVSLTPYVSGYALGVRYEQNDMSNNAGRFVPVVGFQTAAEAHRSFLRNGTGFAHVVGMDIDYKHVANIDQDNMPFQDRWSRIATQNQVVFSVSQSLLRMKDSAAPTEVASMILQWAYDFSGRKSYDAPYVDPLAPFVRVLRNQIDLGNRRQALTDKASDIYGKVSIRAIKNWFLDSEALFDPLNSELVMASVGLGWQKDADHRIGATYRVSSGLAEDVHAYINWRLLSFLRVFANLNYSMKYSYITRGTAGILITPKSDCWNIAFTTIWHTYPSDTSYRIVFNLKGIGSTANR